MAVETYGYHFATNDIYEENIVELELMHGLKTVLNQHHALAIDEPVVTHHQQTVPTTFEDEETGEVTVIDNMVMHRIEVHAMTEEAVTSDV